MCGEDFGVGGRCRFSGRGEVEGCLALEFYDSGVVHEKDIPFVLFCLEWPAMYIRCIRKTAKIKI